MNYQYNIDKWYIIGTAAGKLDAGLQLGSINEPEWFENEKDWENRCKELNIENESNNNTTI